MGRSGFRILKEDDGYRIELFPCNNHKLPTVYSNSLYDLSECNRVLNLIRSYSVAKYDDLLKRAEFLYENETGRCRFRISIDDNTIINQAYYVKDFLESKKSILRICKDIDDYTSNELE